MKTSNILFGLFIIQVLLLGLVHGQTTDTVDTRIDNQRYWRELGRLGLIELNPIVPVPPAIPRTEDISSSIVLSPNSRDILINKTEGVTQSENSVFVDPNMNVQILNSNNSVEGGTVYGANYQYSSDGGQNWNGQKEGAGGNNSGDPSVVISNEGVWYVGYIAPGGGQGVSFSNDQGQTWTPVLVANGAKAFLDKNHLWIDNSPLSPYEGYLYDAWTVFGSTEADREIQLSRSIDAGVSWTTPITISEGVKAGSHNQGINLHTGPNGEVYAVWSIYDSWPSDETSIGFARSLDGGQTFEPAKRIIGNIRGIRNSGVGKNMRVNAFPSMAVDISNGPNRGDIYIVWSNIGIPGTNTGPDTDIYLIRSENGGQIWSAPLRVNQDPPELGKKHYFPWITCDPVTGHLSVISYDDRDVNSTDVETYVAVSLNGGLNWEDFRVSDVSFTPTPIPNLAPGYFGDYLSISARDGIVYPVWTDNRTGEAKAYVSPFVIGCLEDIVVQDVIIDLLESESYMASNTVTFAGSGTTVIVEGDGTLGGHVGASAGGAITFGEGFHAKTGAEVHSLLVGCVQMPTASNNPDTTVVDTTSQRVFRLLPSSVEGHLAIYPNPNHGQFHIQLKDQWQEKESVYVYVVDLMGKLLYQYHGGSIGETLTVNLGNIPQGVYLVKATQGDQKVQSKILIR